MSVEETQEWETVKAYRKDKALDNGIIRQNGPHGLKLKHHYLVIKGKLLRFKLPQEEAPLFVRPKEESIDAVDEQGAKWSLRINRLYPNDLTADLKELQEQPKTFQHDDSDFNQTEMVLRQDVPLVYQGATKRVTGEHHFEHFTIQAGEPKVIDTPKTEAQLRLERTRAKSHQAYVQITLKLIQAAPKKKDAYAKELYDFCMDLKVGDDEKLEVLQMAVNGFPKDDDYYEMLKTQFSLTLLNASNSLPKNDKIDKIKSYFKTAFSFGEEGLTGALKITFEKLFPPPKAKPEPLPELMPSPPVVPRSKEPEGPSLAQELADAGWMPSNPTKPKKAMATILKPEDKLKAYQVSEDNMIEALTNKALTQNSRNSYYESALNYGTAGRMLILKNNLNEATRILELAKKNTERSPLKPGANDFAKEMEGLLTLCKELQEAARLANQPYNPEENAKTAISIYLQAIQYAPEDHELCAYLYTKALQTAEKHTLETEAAALRTMVEDQFTKAIKKASDPDRKAFLEIKLKHALEEKSQTKSHKPGKT